MAASSQSHRLALVLRPPPSSSSSSSSGDGVFLLSKQRGGGVQTPSLTPTSGTCPIVTSERGLLGRERLLSITLGRSIWRCSASIPR
ncbi:hypothetical protein MLD38_011415 [Melastoma candidum]|uniref:Uncharacterized protein n=1 Tax=Melastoma candidum TaxID=119954 RepID=A0ACB9R327_9MYRT|nr:hypothetical protein MLD38_011415 [Melastoma candidum]